MTDFGRRPAVAAANILLKTGQTTSYVDYDDGYYEKGWTDTERFTDNGDGTITDNATGLMWPKDLAGAAANNGASITWQGAIDFAEALDFAGHQDWRLPNLLEIKSIRDSSLSGPPVYSVFDNCPGGLAYSSTTRAADTDNVWTLDLEEGFDYYAPKIYPLAKVFPVRTA